MDEIRIQREIEANRAFEHYDFGPDVIISDSEGWEDCNTEDWIRVVYAEFDPMAETSEKISFHAKFAKDSAKLEEAYAYLVSNGGEIGRMPK